MDEGQEIDTSEIEENSSKILLENILTLMGLELTRHTFKNERSGFSVKSTIEEILNKDLKNDKESSQSKDDQANLNSEISQNDQENTESFSRFQT